MISARDELEFLYRRAASFDDGGDRTYVDGGDNREVDIG